MTRQDMTRGNNGMGWRGHGKAYPNARHERTHEGIALFQPVTDATDVSRETLCGIGHIVGLDNNGSRGVKLVLVGKSPRQAPDKRRVC